MKTVRTHTFRNGKYYIDQDRVEGYCEIPDEDNKLHMIILPGDDLKTLASSLHEAMHANGIPNRYVHDKEGYCTTDTIARFLWRLGWRRTKETANG